MHQHPTVASRFYWRRKGLVTVMAGQNSVPSDAITRQTNARAEATDVKAEVAKQATVDAEARQSVIEAMSLMGYDVNKGPVAGTTRVTVTTLSRADTGDNAAATMRRAYQDHKLSAPKAPSVGATADMVIAYATAITAWSAKLKELESAVLGLTGSEPLVYPIATRYSAVPTNRTSVGGNYTVWCIGTDAQKGTDDALSTRLESHMVRNGQGMPLFFRHRSQGTITVCVTPEQAANDTEHLVRAIEAGINRRYLALASIQERRQAIKATTAKIVAEAHA